MTPEVQSANFNLTARTVGSSHRTTRVLRWIPDAPGDSSFQFIAGPDACGDKAKVKYFRGFMAYGPGTGNFMAMVDGELVAQGSFSGTVGADKSNLASFPRGTSGKEVQIVGSFTGELDRIVILFDPHPLQESS